MRKAIENCTSFGCSRVSFLHSGLYHAIFWVCDENSVDNIVVSVIAEQCLHKVKALSVPHIAPLLSSLGMDKKLGGDTDGTADPR